MNRKQRTVFLAAHMLLCLSVSLHANAQSKAQPTDELQARYLQEVAECEAQQATQDLEACRLEARSALAEARRHLLNDTTANLFEKNQFKRCRVFKGEDREACEARVRNEGSSTGSVQSGGILREVVRPVPPGK